MGLKTGLITTKHLNRLLGALVLLLALQPARVGGQEADSSGERKQKSLSEMLGGGRPVVPAGYFLFPIAPGKPGFLSGSMGELRPHHFHGGLDIKTGGGVNQPVYAAADGYLSRLKQSSFGYGNTLYITHANGLTTVYAHLNEFRGPVAEELLRQQYEKQTYELELNFDKDKFPVKRGEVVALSGNTGGSAGPHLHWEVRDAQDRQYNPLQWGGFAEVQDHVAPILQALAVEPLAIESRVERVFAKAVLVPKVQPAPGAATVWADTISAFGPVGLLVQGFDRFDNAWNKNGIQRVTVRVNGQPFYEHTIDAVPFPAGSRQISNFLDYHYQHTQGRQLQKLWVDEGNDLNIYNTGPGKGRLNVEFDAIGLGIDFTARDVQSELKKKGLPWELAKAFDGSAPISTTFRPVADFADLANINFHLEVNGEVKQRGNSGLMLHPFAKIISFVSQYITLKMGDLIFTGTPSGVGPVKAGDQLHGFLEGEKILDVAVR